MSLKTANLLAGIVLASLGVVRADWPQWLGPNRNGISSEKLSGQLPLRPHVHWEKSVGVGVSSIVVSDGRAFTVGHIRGPVNRGTDTVYCLDDETGELIWKYSYDCSSCQTQDVRFYGPRSTPTIDGDCLYTLSLEGHLYCFKASSGKVMWSRNLPLDFSGGMPLYGYCCSVLVYGRLLVLELNAKDASYVALDKTSGEVTWRLGGGHVTCGSPVLTKIDGIDCVVFMGGSAVVGANIATGTELWRHSTWGHAWMGPVASGNKIFIANTSLPRGCGLIRIDDGKPVVVWQDKKNFQTLHCNSVIWQGHVYGFDNTGTDYQGKDGKKSSLKCLDLDSGRIRWVKEKMGWGNLIVCDGKLIILRETGELVVAEADPNEYQEIIRCQVLDGQSWTIPAFTNGKVYCRNNAGEVVCLELLNTMETEQPMAEYDVKENQILRRDSVRPKVFVPGESVFPAALRQWPRFRGPGGLGFAPSNHTQSISDPKNGQNILWKASISLEGQSSPIIWDNRLFLTGANKDRCEIYCFDSNNGQSLWSRTVSRGLLGFEEIKEEDVLLAAATPVTDGNYVYAIFGTGEVVCVDFEGNTQWKCNLGMPEDIYGHSASLDIWENLLIVQLDQGELQDAKSKLLALDCQSGRMIWTTVRTVPCSWSTPIIINVDGRSQIITCGDPWIIAYEPNTGAEIWRAGCLGGDVVPSPIYIGGLVYGVSPDGALAAIRPDGRGDVTATHILWSSEENLPSICSPVSNGELIWLLDSGGVVTCYDAIDGTKIWEKELDSSFQASPVLANGLLYMLGDNGSLFTIRADREFNLLSRFELGEPCQASAVFQQGCMYIRSKKHLYCLGLPGN